MSAPSVSGTGLPFPAFGGQPVPDDLASAAAAALMSPVPLKKTCEVCSKEKIKCDGKQPVCSRCERLRKPCHYTINKSKQLKVHKIAAAQQQGQPGVELDINFVPAVVPPLVPPPPVTMPHGPRTVTVPGPLAPFNHTEATTHSWNPPKLKRSSAHAEPSEDDFVLGGGHEPVVRPAKRSREPSGSRGPQSWGEVERPYGVPNVPPAVLQAAPVGPNNYYSPDLRSAGAFPPVQHGPNGFLNGGHSGSLRHAPPPQAQLPFFPDESPRNGMMDYGGQPSWQERPEHPRSGSLFGSPAGGSGTELPFASRPIPDQVPYGEQVPYGGPRPPMDMGYAVGRPPPRAPTTQGFDDPTMPFPMSASTQHRRRRSEERFLDFITFEAFRRMDEFAEVVRTYFRNILPFVPLLHRYYYTDMLSDDATWTNFVQQTEMVPVSADLQGADKTTVQNFHLHAKNVLYTVLNQLGVPPSRLPVPALRDLLLVLLCIMPSLSMTLESPVTYSLFMLTLNMARALGMNEEPESGWGVESERGVECPWTNGEKETSRRIWWSLYIVDKQIAAIWEHLPLISDAECRLRLPIGEGFLHDDEDPSPTTQKAHYLADAMANLDVKFQRTAPRSAWFSLIGLQGIIGSITVYRHECVASRTEPYLPNPVLEQLQKRLQTWYDGLDPSVRLMDKEGVILGPTAAAFDRSHTDGPRSVVVLLHTLLVFHAAGCLLHSPTGNLVTPGWEKSPSFHLCMESAIRSGRVLRMMLVAGEESKLTTPFHIFAVHMTALMHVIWLLALKKRLSGRWKLAVVGNVVTVMPDGDGHEGEGSPAPVEQEQLVPPPLPPAALQGSVQPTLGAGLQASLQVGPAPSGMPVAVQPAPLPTIVVPKEEPVDGPERLPTPQLMVTEDGNGLANPLIKGVDPAMSSAFLGADDDDDPSHILFGEPANVLARSDTNGPERPFSPMLTGLLAGNTRDLEDLLGFTSAGDHHQELEDRAASLDGLHAPSPMPPSFMRSPPKARPLPMPDAAPTPAADGLFERPATPGATFLAATVQHHLHSRGDPARPLTHSEVQRMTWSDFFRIIKSLQFHLQTLSVLGTRARVKPLALRSKRVLIGLLEEHDRPGPQNHFSTVLLQDCGLSEVGPV
ncbi:hypothetical protein DFJ74DRAFT_667713 [Hyaloraphidium curvatum]|nr:hypothetical protein DFJ74DRAFT_667713 [Hyaloraphidium curvatum]